MPRAIVFLALLSSAAPVLAQQTYNILEIYLRFVATQVAEKRCGEGPPVNETKFLANMIDVSIRAVLRIKESYPQWSDAQVNEAISSMTNRVRDGIEKLATTEGCSAPSIQQLRALYAFHANWNMGAPTSPAP